MTRPRLRVIPSRVQTLPARVAPYSTRMQRLSGRAGMERRAAVLADDPLCANCRKNGQTRAAVVVDHVVPLWAGGPDVRGNLQGLCASCHDHKSAREARERGSG
jgi:5-methylcytosine-specific restriction protein A